MWLEQTRAMCAQSARQALMLSPNDLISYLSLDSSLSAAALGIQFVVIDIRSSEDMEIGGTIPKAVCLDPELLENEDVLARWIQHFDGTRGCHICIIDLPPVRTSEVYTC